MHYIYIYICVDWCVRLSVSKHDIYIPIYIRHTHIISFILLYECVFYCMYTEYTVYECSIWYAAYKDKERFWKLRPLPVDLDDWYDMAWNKLIRMGLPIPPLSPHPLSMLRNEGKAVQGRIDEHVTSSRLGLRVASWMFAYFILLHSGCKPSTSGTVKRSVTLARSGPAREWRSVERWLDTRNSITGGSVIS